MDCHGGRCAGLDGGAWPLLRLAACGGGRRERFGGTLRACSSKRATNRLFYGVGKVFLQVSRSRITRWQADVAPTLLDAGGTRLARRGRSGGVSQVSARPDVNHFLFWVVILFRISHVSVADVGSVGGVDGFGGGGSSERKRTDSPRRVFNGPTTVPGVWQLGRSAPLAAPYMICVLLTQSVCGILLPESGTAVSGRGEYWLLPGRGASARQ
jgi:hypothetical protein